MTTMFWWRTVLVWNVNPKINIDFKTSRSLARKLFSQNELFKKSLNPVKTWLKSAVQSVTFFRAAAKCLKFTMLKSWQNFIQRNALEKSKDWVIFECPLSSFSWKACRWPALELIFSIFSLKLCTQKVLCLCIMLFTRLILGTEVRALH